MSSRTRARIPDNDYRPTNREILQPLVAKIYVYGIPSNWNFSFSDASVVITTPSRNCSLKVTADHKVTVDRVNGLKVKSSVFSCKSIDEAWSILASTLDSLIPKGAVHA